MRLSELTIIYGDQPRKVAINWNLVQFIFPHGSFGEGKTRIVFNGEDSYVTVSEPYEEVLSKHVPTSWNRMTYEEELECSD